MRRAAAWGGATTFIVIMTALAAALAAAPAAPPGDGTRPVPDRAARPPMTPSRTPDLDVLLRDAQRIQVADTAAWSLYRFRRRTQRYTLDSRGNAALTQDLEFIITPQGSAFDELLVATNGEEPTSQEIDRQRRLAPFTRRYWAMIQGTGESESGGYSLADLLRMSTYRYAGLEILIGVPCHRLDFAPGDAAPADGLKGKFGQAMAGTLWITADGLHLMRARAHTIKPISIALNLTKLHNVELSLEAGPVGDGVYLPSRIEMTTEARVLVVPYRRRNVFQYWDFSRAAEPRLPESSPP